MEEDKIYSTSWDDSGWWFINQKTHDGKIKVYLAIEGEQDDSRAIEVTNALNSTIEKAVDEGVDLIKNMRKGYLSCIEELHKWNGGLDNPCHLDLYNKLITVEKEVNERASELLK